MQIQFSFSRKEKSKNKRNTSAEESFYIRTLKDKTQSEKENVFNFFSVEETSNVCNTYKIRNN